MEKRNYEKPELKKIDARIFRIQELKEKLLCSDFGPEIYDELAIYSEKMKDKGFDTNEYIGFHVAIGSGTGKAFSEYPPDKIDFPGEDSVILELERLEKKYLG